MKVALVIYTLNELIGMQKIMPRIKKEWCDEIVVIDGGSTDGTVAFAQEIGCKVYRQKNRRWAGAYQEAFERVTSDVLIDFSPDGNSIPELIPALIAKIKEGNDMVIASRYTGGAKSEDDSAVTGFGNFMFTGIINFLFGGRYTDALVIYRAYRRSMLEKAGMLNCELDQCVTALLSIRCAKIKAKFADVPGDEPPRVGGERKMNAIMDGLRICGIIVKEFVLFPIAWSKKIRVSF